jgi:hypothetical protein
LPRDWPLTSEISPLYFRNYFLNKEVDFMVMKRNKWKPCRWAAVAILTLGLMVHVVAPATSAAEEQNLQLMKLRANQKIILAQTVGYPK